MGEPRKAPRKVLALGALALLVVAAVVVLTLADVWGAVADWWGESTPKSAAGAKDKKNKKGPAVLFRDAQGNQGLRLSAEAVKALQIDPVPVKFAKTPRPLPPQIGTINYDPDRLFTIRSRFGGEIAEMRTVLDTDAPTAPVTQMRPVRFGDKLKQDDLLAVVWSKDLGTAKAALVDALSNLRLSQDTLARHAKLYEEGALALATFRQSERQVQLDSNAVVTAERTLRMWKLNDDEIKTIKSEAEVIHKLLADKKGRSAAEETKWARVEIRAPKFRPDPNDPKKLDPNTVLTVVEKNTHLNDMVDPINSPPLFKLADLSRLQIWVHPPEEYLPLLREKLRKGGEERPRWQIRFQSDPPDTPPLELDIVQIAPSLEGATHMPMLIGYLDNKDNKYLVGQFITATIFVPPDPDTVEIPTAALNDVEGQALVFVEKDAARREYLLKRVAVVRRFKDVTFVRTQLTSDEEKISRAEEKRGRRPLQPLQRGERVVTRGVVEMTAALESLASKEAAAKAAKPRK